jgi:hypothetical protein
MFIWTNKALAALACVGLTACAGMDMGTQSQPRSVVVQGGDIKVAAPAGYCANPQASTDSAGSAVVLIGRCSATSSATPALITASVGAAGSGAALDSGPVALTRFFTSEQGRSMLASTGNASDAVVTSSETEEASVLLRIKDANMGEYWRAILALKGRLVMLSATGAESVVLPPEQGRALLSKSMAALRSANPDKAAPALGLAGLFAGAKAAPTATPTAATTPTVLVMAPPEGSIRPKPRVPRSG